MKQGDIQVRFQVHMVASVKVIVIWDVALRSLGILYSATSSSEK
jgi:hypothetical protein